MDSCCWVIGQREREVRGAGEGREEVGVPNLPSPPVFVTLKNWKNSDQLRRVQSEQWVCAPASLSLSTSFS